MNPIIFLDIDGVLCIDFTKGTKHRNTDKYGDLFDSECVNQLKQIIDATGADIVISSTWRRAGLQVMKDMWEDRSLPGNVIDITPYDFGSNAWDSWNPYIARGIEIKKWMEINGYPDSYVIIDDDPDMMDYQLPHFVQTELYTGLTKELSDMAIEILQKENDL